MPPSDSGTTGDGLVLSDRLFERLPAQVGAQLSDAHVEGRASCDLTIAFDGNAENDVDVMKIDGKIELDGLCASPPDLAYPVSDTRALITIADSVVTIENIDGYLDGDRVGRPLCPMHIDGKVYLNKDDLDYKVNVAFEHFNIDDRITSVILPFQRPMFRVAGPVGWMKFHATVVPPPNPEIDARPFYDGVMDVQDITFDIQPTGSQFRCVMPNLSGRIDASSGSLRKGRLAGVDPKGRHFELSGSVFNMNVEGAMLFDIVVSVERIDLAHEVRAFLSPTDDDRGIRKMGVPAASWMHGLISENWKTIRIESSS